MTWDLGLTQVSQDVDVRFAVLVRPWVVLRDETAVDVGVDLAKAKVRDVDVTVHQVTPLPVGRASDLFGPVGRRALDRISGEAIRQFLRRLGRRDLAIETPIATWLILLGAAPGRVPLSVHDGCGELRFDAPEDWAWDPPPRGESRTPPGTIVVDVDPTRAAPLVEHWLAALAGTHERYAVTTFLPGAGTIGDGGGEPTSMGVVLERDVGGPLPALTLPISVEVVPRVLDTRIVFDLVDLRVRTRWGGTRVLGVVSWLLARRLRPRLAIPGRWDLSLPFGDKQAWLLGARSIEIGHDSARVVLDTWFTPA